MIRNLFLLVVFLGCVSLRHVEAAIDIIPKPVKLVETDGRFDITSACSIVVNDDLKTCGVVGRLSSTGYGVSFSSE